MKWRKENLLSNNLKIARYILVVLAIVTFLKDQKTLLFTLLLILIILYIHHYYFQYLGKRLFFENKKKVTRLSVGDEGEWWLTFINKGLPIVKGSLILSFDDFIHPNHQLFHVSNSSVEMELPFHAWHNEKIEIRVPIQAMKRGISKINKLELRIQHLFGSGTMLLTYTDFIKQKIMVYPEMKAVHFLQENQSYRQGYQDTKSSLFIDRLQPIGTRDYAEGDSFGNIHWKASARMQKLQTKLFPQTGVYRWLFVFNVSDGYRLNSELEDLIKYLAFLVDYATKKNIPFSIAINARTTGKYPYFYLSEGEGRAQRQKAFEMLAMGIYPFAYPYEQMLKIVSRNGSTFPVIIHIGELNNESTKYLAKLKRQNSTILEVKAGVLKEWKQPSIINHG